MPRDLVVVVPGVMGSSLADERGREVWGLSGGSVLCALRTLGGLVRDLTLPAGFGEGPAPDRVRPTGLIPAFHVIPGVWTPVEGYARLERFLLEPRFGLSLDQPDSVAAQPGNLVLFAYDWYAFSPCAGLGECWEGVAAGVGGE
jgi:hypothetical protein